MRFRDKHPRGGLPARESGYIKGVIGRKIKVVAEEEIQLVLSELEQRIRARIQSDVQVEVGEVTLGHNMNEMQDKLDIRIHVVSQPNNKNGTRIDVSGLEARQFEYVKREAS